MNKIKFIFILIVTSVITGCTLTKDKEFAPIDENGYTLVYTDFKALKFSEDQLLWPEGAAIGVFGTEMGNNEAYVIKNAYVEHSQASFYGPLVKGQIAAYYPYDSSYIGDADAMPMNLEADQAYDADLKAMYLKYNPTAFAHLSDGKMDFYYPTGLLCLQLGFPEAETVKNLRLDSQTTGLSGLGVVSGDGTVQMTESASRYVTLDCGEGLVTMGEGEVLTSFPVVLLPGTYDDLQVSVYLEGSEQPFVCKLPEVVIEKIDASANQMQLTTITVTLSQNGEEGPDGFVEEEVEFEE